MSNLLLLTGLALVGYGLWLIYEPAAIIYAGLVCVLLSLAWDVARDRREQ